MEDVEFDSKVVDGPATADVGHATADEGHATAVDGPGVGKGFGEEAIKTSSAGSWLRPGRD